MEHVCLVFFFLKRSDGKQCFMRRGYDHGDIFDVPVGKFLGKMSAISLISKKSVSLAAAV